MNKVVQFEKRHVRPSVRLQLANREEVIRCMAEHLVAGIMGGLNTSCDYQVIEYLLNTPERFQSRVVLNHMDDAMYVAKMTLVTAELCGG